MSRNDPLNVKAAAAKGIQAYTARLLYELAMDDLLWRDPEMAGLYQANGLMPPHPSFATQKRWLIQRLGWNPAPILNAA